MNLGSAYATKSGADPVFAAALRFTIGLVIAFSLLAFGPASIVAGVALTCRNAFAVGLYHGDARHRQRLPAGAAQRVF